MKMPPAIMVATLLVLPFVHAAAIPAGEPVTGRDLALCVGINNYIRMGKLKYCVSDAKAVGSRLEETGAFRKVAFLIDTDEAGAPLAPHYLPTQNTILTRLEQLARIATPDDRLFFFFSGHGVVHDGESCIVPIDGNEATAIPLAMIKGAMAKSRARHKLMIIDACRSGGGVKGMAGVREALEDQGVGVLVSCGAEQFSYEDDASGRSLFTLVLEDALGGAADYDGDGEITGEELFRHLDNGMGDYFLTRDILASQTPEINESALAMPFVRVNREAAAERRLSRERERKAAEGKSLPARGEASPAALQTREDAELLRLKIEIEEQRKALLEIEANRQKYARAMSDAEAHMQGGNYALARDRFAEALAISEYGGDPRALAGRTEAAAKAGEMERKREADNALKSGRTHGKRKEYTQAVVFYRKSAEMGNDEAQNALGTCYDKGWGVGKDQKEAVKWYRLAAEQGNASAQWNLAVSYDEGEGVAKNAAEAFKWYKKAADQGDAKAQHYVGRGYMEGRGTTINYEEGVLWFKKAADQGFQRSAHQLGGAYSNGKGVAKNPYEAARLYRIAADQGNATAQHDLAHLYYEGRGVPRDLNEAKRLLRLALEKSRDISHSDGKPCNIRHILGY